MGEEVRSILDGHIYLSRKLGEEGALSRRGRAGEPSSRLYPRVTDPGQRAAAARLRLWLAKHAEVELMLQIGEYKPGGDPDADEAIARMPRIEALLRQEPGDGAPIVLHPPAPGGGGGVSAASQARSLPAMRRLHALRERRLRAAEQAAAAAQALVRASEAELAAADARIAAVDARRAEIEGWFQSRLDPRHIDAALAHRAALADARTREDGLRAEAAEALNRARTELDAALRTLARARTRLDLAAGQVKACLRAADTLAEAAAEEAYEDSGRSRRAPGLMGARGI